MFCASRQVLRTASICALDNGARVGRPVEILGVGGGRFVGMGGCTCELVDDAGGKGALVKLGVALRVIEV